MDSICPAVNGAPSGGMRSSWFFAVIFSSNKLPAGSPGMTTFFCFSALEDVCRRIQPQPRLLLQPAMTLKTPRLQYRLNVTQVVDAK